MRGFAGDPTVIGYFFAFSAMLDPEQAALVSTPLSSSLTVSVVFGQP